MSESNEYMEQVMANQQKLAVDLRAKRQLAPAKRGAAGAPAIPEPQGAEDTGRFAVARQRFAAPATSEPAPAASVDVKITGWWRWKTVIVPPNAHVVHTRRGHDRPLHIGLGVSFGYDPAKDSFLVVPGTMQTILINAHCICRELLGLLVQGYVQWIIADFATAYKKLDFTDVEDPMRVVNLQLREQAEAAIKDKVATMGIDEVLSDKQPIIEELTARLRNVAEGEGDTDKGLGLRIVTVQIKEAVVSSRRVWENLQKPFRADRARVARLAELEAETVISARERVTERDRESAQLEADAEIAKLRAAQEAEVFDRDQAEASRRVQREQEVSRLTAAQRHETALHAAELEKVRIARDAEVARARAKEQVEAHRLQLEAALAAKDLQRAADNRQAEVELRLLEARQRVANETSAGNLQARLIEALPLVAEKLPKPAELRAITIGGAGGGDGGAASLASLVAQMAAILESFRALPPAADPRRP
jgi:regulator of protease activity HflC (stomatin/prohibitin superfamily)